jgi:hypothetical protein
LKRAFCSSVNEFGQRGFHSIDRVGKGMPLTISQRRLRSLPDAALRTKQERSTYSKVVQEGEHFSRHSCGAPGQRDAICQFLGEISASRSSRRRR